jgi:putative tricarboxylic transport membrane protein
VRIVLKMMGVKSWAHAVIFGAAVALTISAFFIELLEVRMPEGLLEGLT